jgi:DNA-binding MarR family transcriptional regulator
MKKSIKFEIDIPKININAIDWFILQNIRKNEYIGTMELAKKTKLAPKNLIAHIDKLEKHGCLQRDKISAKPKGWKRIYIITHIGKKALYLYSSIIAYLEFGKELHMQKNINLAFK